MKLLVVTQKVDKNDDVLSFFHRWLAEFATHFESLIVICLYEGEHDLPENVTVLSLGKESGVSKLQYVIRFYKYIFNNKAEYDSVFVHMNQEYVLLAGPFWRLFGKRVGMWRNHHAGSFMTSIAVWLCNKTFCTSQFSYINRFKKNILMPVGIDAALYKEEEGNSRKNGSILSLGRIAPVKKIDTLIEAVAKLHKKGISFSLSIYGNPNEEDTEYYMSLKDMVRSGGLEEYITFYEGIPFFETPAIYNEHDIFVNISTSGMYDKTIFEAMICGCVVLASNDNLRKHIDESFVFSRDDTDELADKLEKALALSSQEKGISIKKHKEFVSSEHSLSLLGKRVYEEYT